MDGSALSRTVIPSLSKDEPRRCSPCGGFFTLVRGMYAAASGALVAQSAVDTIANNLANVNTAGFKRTLLQVQAQPQRELFRFQTDPGRSANARTAGVPAQARIGALGTGAQI